MSALKHPTLQDYAPKQTPAALLWAIMALMGLVATLVFFVIYGLGQQSWALRLREDTLTLLFVVPSVVAIGTWYSAHRGYLKHFERKELRDLQYLLLASWTAVSASIAVAHVWADRAWIVPSLPAPLALALGTGALLPLLISTLFPRALSRENASR